MRPVVEPSAWVASDFADCSRYVRRFAPAEIEEIDNAVRALKREGVPLHAVKPHYFPLPQLGSTLAKVQTELEDGRGFQVLRGIPVEMYERPELELVLVGLLSHMGTLVAQDT